MVSSIRGDTTTSLETESKRTLILFYASGLEEAAFFCPDHYILTSSIVFLGTQLVQFGEVGQGW